MAAILNIIPGLGYLYLGKRKVFSYLLLTAALISFIDGFLNPWTFETPTTFLYWVAVTIAIFTFMYDAFNEAKNM